MTKYCWTCDEELKPWEIGAYGGQCEDCLAEAEDQAERDNAAQESEAEAEPQNS